MKLSEAIRIGSKMNPHNKGMTIFEVIDGVTYSCALGAAIRGYQTIYPEASLLQMSKTVAGLLSLAEEIIIRNSKQSREEIAAWMESQGY